MEKTTIQKLFLTAFTQKLIEITTPSEIPESSTQEKQEYKPSENRVQIVQPRIPQIVRPGQIMSPSKRVNPQPITPFENKLPITKPQEGYLDLKKINILIADPRVNSIECPGPNKNVMVKKDSAVQKTPIILTKEEISEIINSFSEKTRIPVIGGTFKAVSSNLSINAIISEYVGTRFSIQKRNPMNPY